jgi:hypothetical protein
MRNLFCEICQKKLTAVDDGKGRSFDCCTGCHRFINGMAERVFQDMAWSVEKSIGKTGPTALTK